MVDFAIFSEQVAIGLMAIGFELRGNTEKAWFFEDSMLLREAIEELLKAFTDDNN